MSRFHRFRPAAGLFMAFTASVPANTTIDATAKYAWGANPGWVNFAANTTDGVVVGGSFLSGHAWAANTGWIIFGDGTPANGHSYGNTSAADFGVNHDGTGNLSGHAWSPNTGWIHFGWASATDPNRPRFHLQSGQFSGHAWSANTGWLNLGTGLLVTTSIQSQDADSDGIDDAWEMLHFGNLSAAGSGTDHDHDGESDADEYEADTDPENPASHLRIVSHGLDSGLTGVTLVFSVTRPTRLYRIEVSNNLGGTPPWTNSPLGTFAPDSGTTTSKTFSFPGNPRKFFRVVVLLPLSP